MPALVLADRGGARGAEARSERPARTHQKLVVATLLFLDVSLALLIWEAAFAVQGIWGRGPLSDLAIAAILPNVAVWIGLRALLGLYPGYGLDEVEELRRQTYAVLATAAISAVFAVAFQAGDSVSRLQLAVGFLGLLLLAPLLQHMAKRVMSKARLWSKPVIVFGSGESGARITQLLRQEWKLGYDPVACLDFHLAPARQASSSANYEEALAQAVDLTGKQRIDMVILAMPHTRREQVAELVAWASLRFRHVLVVPNLAGITNSAVVLRDLSGTFAVEIKHNLLDPWALRAKRAMDLSFTLIGGLLIFPLILLLALLVYLESPGGSVIYKDRRMGRNGDSFSCIKFRTMTPDAEAALWRLLREDPELREEYLKYHKLRDDPRITRVGHFLRKTSLDELPQLYNVLRGEMSLVGPRPYLYRESEDIGISQGEILRVPPGITGPWQVTGRSHTSFEERVQMDAYYVRDWSVWLDLILLIRTVKIVVLAQGSY